MRHIIVFTQVDQVLPNWKKSSQEDILCIDCDSLLHSKNNVHMRDWILDNTGDLRDGIFCVQCFLENHEIQRVNG